MFINADPASVVDILESQGHGFCTNTQCTWGHPQVDAPQQPVVQGQVPSREHPDHVEHRGAHHRRRGVEVARVGAARPREVHPQPTVGDVLVEPAPAVGGRDSFVFAPGEQRIDERFVIPQLFESPCPSVGQVEALATQHRFHLTRIAQVDLLTRFELVEHDGIATGAVTIGGDETTFVSDIAVDDSGVLKDIDQPGDLS